MARKPGSTPSAMKTRAAKTAAAMAPAGAAATAAAPAAPKKRTTPVQFFREVRAETRKITWTSRKETWITSVMVFIMVVLASLFFMAVDGGLGLAINQLLKLATSG
jgi:preprotein translocase subunit SecE